MKSFFTIVALAGFVGVALFGAFLMIHASNVSHTSCLPALMRSNECTSVNPVEYVRVHVGAITELVSGIPSFSVSAVFTILLVFLYAVFIAELDDPLLVLQEQTVFSREDGRSIVREKVLRWIALHEKRDPSLAIALST